MACSIPNFVNDIPTIELLDPFPIVCATNFPPALTIPDIPLPPCIDGLSFTSSGINVIVNQGSGYLDMASASSSFSVTEGACSFDLGGTITINLPSVSVSIGGGGGDGGCPPDSDGNPQVKNASGNCEPIMGCMKDAKYGEIRAVNVSFPCSDTSELDISQLGLSFRNMQGAFMKHEIFKVYNAGTSAVEDWYFLACKKL